MITKIATNKRMAMVIGIVMSLCFLTTGVFAQDKGKDKKAAEKKEDPKKKSDGWRISDYKPYIKSLEDLRKLSNEYAERNLQLGINEYDKGMALIDDMENEVLRIETKGNTGKNLNERWHWQEIDRKNNQKRLITRLKYTAKMKSVTHFIRAINLLDEIQEHNKKFITENASFKRFKVRLYQVYISTQYDLQNYRPCIPILERYLSISEETKGDVWAYRYLASCYGFMEAVLNKYKSATEDEIIEYKQKKNRSLLRAAELKYAIDSPEYKRLKDIIERDELKSEVINDFR